MSHKEPRYGTHVGGLLGEAMNLVTWGFMLLVVDLIGTNGCVMVSAYG